MDGMVGAHGWAEENRGEDLGNADLFVLTGDPNDTPRPISVDGDPLLRLFAERAYREQHRWTDGFRAFYCRRILTRLPRKARGRPRTSDDMVMLVERLRREPGRNDREIHRLIGEVYGVKPETVARHWRNGRMLGDDPGPLPRIATGVEMIPYEPRLVGALDAYRAGSGTAASLDDVFRAMRVSTVMRRGVGPLGRLPVDEAAD